MNKTRVIKWVTAISLFLFILSVSILFVIFYRPLYSMAIGWFDIESMTGLSKLQLESNYQQLMDYLTKPWVSQLAMTNFPSSEQGLFHFYEVKRLFMVDYVVVVVTLGILYYGAQWLQREGKLWLLLNPLKLLLMLPFVVLTMVAFFFDPLFVLFHKVFFNNDAWIFDVRTDPVIAALPQDFFLVCFAAVFILLMLGLFLAHTAIKNSLKPRQ